MSNLRPLFIGYMAVLHAALVVALVGTDYFVPKSSAPMPQQTTAHQPVVDWMERARKPHRELDPFVPDRATIFLGDSITYALPTVALAPLAVNYGIGGQRSDQLLESMQIYTSMARAARVVVTIGTNDLLQGREAGIEARYDAILSKIKVPVVMSSILPIETISAARAHNVVAAAKKACGRHQLCTFVDVYDVFTDGGSVRPGLLSDGIHLTRPGYELWIAALRPSLKKGGTSSKMNPAWQS